MLLLVILRLWYFCDGNLITIKIFRSIKAMNTVLFTLYTVPTR